MVEGHVKQLEVVVVHQNSSVLHFVKILWSCISCGWEIDMGMDCRHNSFSRKNGDLYPLLYWNLFWQFSPVSAQTHWFRIFGRKGFPWLLRNASYIFISDSNEAFETEISENYFVLLTPTVVTWSEIETKIGGLMCLLSAFYTNSIDLTDGAYKIWVDLIDQFEVEAKCDVC